MDGRGQGEGSMEWGWGVRDKGRKEEPGHLGREKRGQSRDLSRRQKRQKLGKDCRVSIKFHSKD